MNIVFCINRLGLIGLGVTVSSLIRNSSDSAKLKIWFLCANLNLKDKAQISRLLVEENFKGEYHLIDFDPIKHFGSYCSLHGDWTTYGRLLIPELVKADEVLYLDADLVIEVDVLELSRFSFEGHAIAAVGGGKFRYTLGSNFYINKLGISPDVEYFNAGILFLNLKEWRNKNIKEDCMKIADRYPMDLPSHDQSLLNIFFSGYFKKLPSNYNCEWLAYNRRPDTAAKMVLHFVGSPKPWDPFGFIIHKGYKTWKGYLNPTWSSAYGSISGDDLGRVWKIRKSYMRSFVRQFKNK
jgi:lipopolysaccharide biosynthesis glycosyltransferase